MTKNKMKVAIKKYLLFHFIVILVLIMNGCATTQQSTSQQSTSTEDEEFKKTMNSWVGLSKKQLIFQMGPPTSVTSDGGTGEILIYEELRRAFILGRYITAIHKKMFYVDSNGIIYHWRYERSGREGF